MNESSMIAPANPRASAIAAKIEESSGDRSAFFVFPTQVSADSWAEVSLRTRGKSAVEADRFIGWDDFLIQIRSPNIPANRKAADQKSRLLWAFMILKEQVDQPFLRSLMKPGIVPALPLAANLARLAPSLPKLATTLRALSAIPATPAKNAEIADYIAMADRYSRFLEKHRLYEPDQVRPAREESCHFILFEPALMPGFAAMSQSLIEACSIELFELEPRGLEEKARDRALLKFRTFREEAQYVAANCAALLENGARPEEIAISAPDCGPEFQAHVKSLARQFALPIEFRSGEPLSSSPFGKLLASLSRASSEGFSLRTMERLFDRGPFRWKADALARGLIRYAAKFHIPEFSADKRYMSELWAKTFSACADPGAPLIDFYDALRKAALSIEGAGSFSALRRALYDFKNGFFEDDALPYEADRRLARIFEELDTLEQWHTHLDQPELSAKPFDILMLALDETSYKDSAQGKAGAISIYPFHLGMLVAGSIHFVLDLSQNSLDSALNYLSRTPKELQQYLGEGTDVSRELLESFNAVNAVYCHAERSLSGYSVPHPYFSGAGATVKTIRLDEIPMTFDSGEIQAWRESAPDMMPIAQPENRRGAAMGIFPSGSQEPRRFPPPAMEGTRIVAARPLAKRRLLGLPACDATPYIKISPARLKNMTQCPFKWFASCVPGIDKGPSALADLAEGSLSHDLIRAVLLEAAARDGAFNPAHIEAYLGWLDISFKKALASITRQNGPSIEPAMKAAYPKIRHRIAQLLNFESDFSAEGWDIGNFEVSLFKVYEDLGLTLEGRADRISARRSDSDSADEAETWAVIDYKKKTTPKKRDFLADENGKLRDFQIASYAAMLEGQGKPVERALYWSIEESKPYVVFGQGGARADSSAFDPERKALAAALASVSRIVDEGGFLAITPSAESCASCSMKPLCRAHFSSERP